MKTKFLRVTALILVLITCLSAFAGCSGKDEEEEAGTALSGTVESLSDEAEQYLPAQVDLGGYEYRMLVSHDPKYFMHIEGTTGEVIDTALYNRELFLEEYFNITYTAKAVDDKDDALYNMLQEMVLAGEDFADVLCMHGNQTLSQAAPKGLLTQLNDKEGFNLSASYWDQRIQTEYDINGRLFALEGDFSIYDELRTMGILYNTKMYKDLQYDSTFGSPYDLVREGKWTYEKYKQMVANSSTDEGETGLDKDDTVGVLAETITPYYFFLGSGSKITKTVNGRVTLMFDTQNELITNTLTDLIKYFDEDPDTVIITKGFFSVDSDDKMWAAANEKMMQGENFIRTSTLIDAVSITKSMTDFGMLPIPKYTEDQDGYYCWVSSSAGAHLSIPATSVNHIDNTVTITEAMCYFSRYSISGAQTLYDAFFDHLSLTSLCQTANDYEMMEKIFASKTYDIEAACNFTGIYYKVHEMLRDGKVGDFSSSLASSIQSAEKGLSDYLKDLLKNAKT